MHLALYRKYRPVSFDEVIGQEHIVTTLKNQVKNDTVSHAYLFTGSRGTGKTTCAKIFSRAMNCLSPIDGSPCGKCDACVGLSSANNTDILEIDAASNNRVDEIRDLRENVKYPAIIGRKKVYIIDEVHMLTDSAFNALLKTLEEPPEHVVFILATTEIHKLPATILSRCMKFDFHLVSVAEISALLKRVLDAQKIEYDDQSIELIATAGDGSVRDALSIADAVISFSMGKLVYDQTLSIVGRSSSSSLTPLIEAIIGNNIPEIFLQTTELKHQGKSVSTLIKDLSIYLRNLILIKSGVKDPSILHLTTEEIKDMESVSLSASIERLSYAFNELSDIEQNIKYSLDPELIFQSACIKAAGSETQKSQISDISNAVKTVQREKEDCTVKWGLVLREIKERNLYALSTASKNIYNVELSNNTLILYTGDKTSFDLLSEKERKDILLNLVQNHFDKVTIIVVKFSSTEKPMQDLTNDLKNIFGKNLRIE